MPNPQLLHDKQSFIDYLNKFIGIIDAVKEGLITQRKDADLMNYGDTRDKTLFWLNTIEDAANSLGSSLEKYDKCDIVKAITCLIFQLFFSDDNNKQSIDNLMNNAHTRTRER